MTMTPMTPAIYLSLLCRIYLYYYIYIIIALQITSPLQK